jgi:hypothetical protein
MQTQLAHLLLRRKELDAKVKQLATLKAMDVYETRGKRVKITDSTEDLVLSVPKLTAAQVTAEYDFYARALRLVDAAVQQANWATLVEIDPKAMADYAAPAQPATPAVVTA